MLHQCPRKEYFVTPQSQLIILLSCTRTVNFRKTPIQTRLVMNATNQIIFIAWPKFLNCQKIYKDKEASSRKEKERLLEEIVLRHHE